MNPQDSKWNRLFEDVMKTTSQPKGRILWTVTIWYTNWSPCRERWRTQTQQWKKNGTSSRQFKHGSWIRSRARKKFFWKHRESTAKSTLHHWWTCVILKKRGIGIKFQKYQGRVVLRGDIVKDDSGACAVFTRHGSSASQMTAARRRIATSTTSAVNQSGVLILWTCPSLPCRSQWCDWPALSTLAWGLPLLAVSFCIFPQLTHWMCWPFVIHLSSKKKRSWVSLQDYRRNICVHPSTEKKTLRNCLEFRSQSVQICGYVFHDTDGQHSNIEDPVVPLERNVYLLNWNGRKYRIGTAYVFSRNKIYASRYTWMTLKLQEISRIRLLCERNWWKTLISINLHHSLIKCTGDALYVKANKTKILWNKTKTCSSHVLLLEQLKIYQDGKNITQKQQHGPTTRKEIVNWPTRRQSSCTRFRVLTWMIITSEQLYKVSSPCLDDHHFKKEELESVGELSEFCSQVVFIWLYLARIGRPDILWSVYNFARSVTKSTQACDRRLARLISHINHTSNYRQYSHVGHAAQHCRLGLFQDSDCAGALEDSKSTSGWMLCVFGSHGAAHWETCAGTGVSVL